MCFCRERWDESELSAPYETRLAGDEKGGVSVGYSQSSWWNIIFKGFRIFIAGNFLVDDTELGIKGKKRAQYCSALQGKIEH
jgi:hypothetical protein